MAALRLIGIAVAGILAVALAGPAAAHPHVFVDARSEIVFDKAGEITAIHHIWQFDEAFTAFAIQGLDANGDGKLSDAELAPLAKVNIDSLKDYDFFTWLRQGKRSYPFVTPTEYWLQFNDGRLTLFFTLPLKKPVAIHGKATLEVFDPEYFVAFTFPEHKPVTMIDAPPGCTARYHPPQLLDAKTMAELAAVPASQHDLPPDLQNAAAALANLIFLDCPGEATGSAVDPFEAVMAGAGSKPAATPNAPAAPAPQAVPPTPATRPAPSADAAPAAAQPQAVAAAPTNPAAPPPAAPAEPAAVQVAANGETSAPPAVPAPAAKGDAATGGATTGTTIAIVLAMLFAGGIAVAGFFLQRNLRRGR